MIKTVKLYDREPYLTEAEATVLQCLPFGEGVAVSLDQTCFFAEGGGQTSDSGTLAGMRVTKVFEKENAVWHVVERAPTIGEKVHLSIEPQKRRDDIEVHTGEHILSGTALKLFGVKNVGFHIGRDFATADFDRVLTEQEVDRLERACNIIIRENRPISVSYPPRELLPTMGLRKMPETEAEIRVVVVEGADACACCGTHAKQSGEVGLLKILSAEKFRGGTRIAFLCGRKASELLSEEHRILTGLSQLYSTRPEKLPDIIASEREELRGKKLEAVSLERELARLIFEKYASEGSTHLELTLPYGMNILKEIAAVAAERKGMSVALYGDGYYVLAKNEHSDYDLAAKNAELKKNGAAGGGRGNFYSGKQKI